MAFDTSATAIAIMYRTTVFMTLIPLYADFNLKARMLPYLHQNSSSSLTVTFNHWSPDSQ
jgi:hypothetical protein